MLHYSYVILFFFNDTATTEIYTLSLHDALPIFVGDRDEAAVHERRRRPRARRDLAGLHDAAVVVDLAPRHGRSEEHTSELQSRQYLVCRLLLEKKKIKQTQEQPYY